MVAKIFFYTFSTLLVLSALKVITAKNPVHAVLFLVLAFVNSSCLWIMLNAEFLALILIVVYVGAVMVLFLFVVMMLDIDIETLRKGFWKNFPLALVLGIIILVEMVTVIITKPTFIDMPITVNNFATAQTIGWYMYTQYSYPVELASIILLLALVVAVALTLRKSDKKVKYQNTARQIAVNSKVGRIEMIKMPSEKP